ncbi:MarR family winged helix-turn-helix transcriptional regulator [Streptomyces rubiginosohelvolus]|uniref:MarR family winged helix-turn-helix transcriptional regulator n=1 Tax=unclassified Streptomyces TaxID=2593676 RepID=UPI00190A705E|nr:MULTISPECIES: MarR family transcriptional regulator [unclassified Streptomyces]MBK3533901.1 MarR family transcriptional regulator [Streptomyces sp. MBT72]MBK3540558.1 MarR family transcriptional regulator [Streptomyces sp. MBT67]MBK3554470.1 MarR family transcriptional regulator [Streptomyces sp. MBT61]MBK6032428.1 MarR family transcriptional regulator [Streptomyces sp. MBT59]
MSGTDGREEERTSGHADERTSGHADDEQPRWLDEQEKAAWTGLISLVLLLPGKLESPLRQEHGITLFEYLVLSHLSEAPGRKLRMGELAFLASGSLSRLSNVIKRCEQRGWVVRTPDPADGRYTLAELTDAGFDIVREAAPTHLRAVRGLVLDSLNTADQKALVRIAEKMRIVPDDFG